MSDPNQQVSQALAKSAAEVGTLRDNVNSGRLSIDLAAGEQICSMLAEHRDKVDTWLKQAGNLARPAPLGQNPVGTAMAAKFVSLADSNNDDSFAAVLTRYRQVLGDAHDAVSDAVRRYQAVDDASADSLRKFAE